MLLALLAETAIAMAGYEMETRKETKVRKGRGYGRERHHPTGSMVWSPSHSTVTRSIEKGKAKKTYSSNWDPIPKWSSPTSLRISVGEEWFLPDSSRYFVLGMWISKTMR